MEPDQIQKGFDVGLPEKPNLACRELTPLLTLGNSVFGDIAIMSHCLQVLLPRLAACKVETNEDWFYLGHTSQFAQVLGSTLMVKHIAWTAAVNASLAQGLYARSYCACARLPGGDLRLGVMLPFLANPDQVGYHCAIRLGTEAYWRGDLKHLDAAMERAETAPESQQDLVTGTHILELLLLQACRDKLVYGSANLADVFAQLAQLDPAQRRVYTLDAMHLFLSRADASTVGMLAQGFSLFNTPES